MLAAMHFLMKIFLIVCFFSFARYINQLSQALLRHNTWRILFSRIINKTDIWWDYLCLYIVRSLYSLRMQVYICRKAHTWMCSCTSYAYYICLNGCVLTDNVAPLRLQGSRQSIFLVSNCTLLKWWVRKVLPYLKPGE